MSQNPGNLPSANLKFFQRSMPQTSQEEHVAFQNAMLLQLSHWLSSDRTSITFSNTNHALPKNIF